MFVPSFNYFALVVTEILLILCLDTSYLQNLWRHHLSNLHSFISLERETISDKGKQHISSLWKSFRISSTCFHFIGTLIAFDLLILKLSNRKTLLIVFLGHETRLHTEVIWLYLSKVYNFSLLLIRKTERSRKLKPSFTLAMSWLF